MLVRKMAVGLLGLEALAKETPSRVATLPYHSDMIRWYDLENVKDCKGLGRRQTGTAIVIRSGCWLPVRVFGTIVKLWSRPLSCLKTGLCTVRRPGVKVKDVLSFVLVHFLRSKKGNSLRRQNFLHKLSRTFQAHLTRVVKHQGRINILVRTRRNDVQRRYFKQVFRLEVKNTLGRSPAQVQCGLQTTLVPLFLNIVFGFEGSLEQVLSTEQQAEICERLGLSICVSTPRLLEAFRSLLQPELVKYIASDSVVLKLLSSKHQLPHVAQSVSPTLEEQYEHTLPETARDSQDEDSESC